MRPKLFLESKKYPYLVNIFHRGQMFHTIFVDYVNVLVYLFDKQTQQIIIVTYYEYSIVLNGNVDGGGSVTHSNKC